MLVCVFLFYCGLQVTAGCTRMESQEFFVSRSPGESVLLSCCCPDNHGIIKWTFGSLAVGSSLQSTDRTVVSNETERYRGRVSIFDQTPSSNFSLLISNLSEEDAGNYYCGESTYVHLVVRGCSLSENKQHVEVSRSPGESVFLSCSCTHLRNHAWSGELRVKWRSPHHEDLHSTQLSPHYSGRVQMFNEESPGNLSLLISDLTEEDSGLYSCWINHNQHRNFTLTVTVMSSGPWKPTSKQILLSLVLLLVLLVLVFAGTYCTCVKGRKQNSQEKRGESKHNEVEETVVLYIQTASLTGSIRQQERSVSSPTQP
ncbi:uncharacterized protein LOC143486755 [Brachyhypopomus gauderio]|uniref:uncharacterized protein LOC143486755 n=1 Tax=Brachyhypopomus gauderio TaxID=698409 RepID=UPI0040438AD5